MGDLIEVEQVLARVPRSRPGLAVTVLRPAALMVTVLRPAALMVTAAIVRRRRRRDGGS